MGPCLPQAGLHNQQCSAQWVYSASALIADTFNICCLYQQELTTGDLSREQQMRADKDSNALRHVVSKAALGQSLLKRRQRGL